MYSSTVTFFPVAKHHGLEVEWNFVAVTFETFILESNNNIVMGALKTAEDLALDGIKSSFYKLGITW